ncbi:MAG TPA: TlpA disulfide reductase family protein [Methylobacterium sp.]
MPRKAALAAGAVAVALGAGLALYGSGSTGGNPGAPCAEAAGLAARVRLAAQGEVAAFQASETPKPASPLAFKGPDGADLTLADLKGRTLLLNLWATWCAPCKAEMPALDRLQAEMGGPDFAVVAINLETRNLDKPPLWLKENGIAHLAYYGDPGGRVLPALQRETGTVGLPTTMLIDARGCTLGILKGPAEWAGADAKRLIGAALGRS